MCDRFLNLPTPKMNKQTIPRRKEIVRLYAEQNPEKVQFILKERPYKIPKGYLHMSEIASLVGLMVGACGNPSYDQASALNAWRTALWFVQDAPIYLLSTSLLRAFEASDVHDQNKLFANLEIPLPTFMVLLPENAIHSPDGGCVDYFVVHVSHVDRPEWSRGSAYGITIPYLQHDHPVNLHWSTIDTNQTAWFSGMGLYEDGRIEQTDGQLGANPTSPADKEFLAKMRSLMLQCLLSLRYAPQLLEETETTTRQATGKNKPTTQPKAKYRLPRWLGKGYKVKSPTTQCGAKRKSPRGHWREGHDRRVPVGPGREGREWRWIEPTFVGEE
jgi:hypothetical protein